LIKIQICDKRHGALNFKFLYYFPETSLTPSGFASDTPKGCRHPRLGTPGVIYCSQIKRIIQQQKLAV